MSTQHRRPHEARAQNQGSAPSGRAHAPAQPSDLDRLGGLPALQRIMDRLVDHMVQDVMIGFFFAHVNRRRLTVLETAYAASHLGGAPYRARPVPEAHRPLPIAHGHFARRLQLLREALAWAQVPADVQARWLAHQEALRPSIVGGSSACPTPP